MSTCFSRRVCVCVCVPRWKSALRYKLNVAAQSACGAYIKAFAECCSDKTLSVVFACRPQLNEMNACLKRWYAHFTQMTMKQNCSRTDETVMTTSTLAAYQRRRMITYMRPPYAVCAMHHDDKKSNEKICACELTNVRPSACVCTNACACVRAHVQIVATHARYRTIARMSLSNMCWSSLQIQENGRTAPPFQGAVGCSAMS